jgi:hypothetical protein
MIVLFVMLSTYDMLKVWSGLQPNRCKLITDLGLYSFGIYMDGSFQLIKVKPETNPALNPVEEALLTRSLLQAINGAYDYSIKIKTVRKHRLLYQVWLDHEAVDVSGFAEEADLSDALLRAYIQVTELSELQWEKEVQSKDSIFDRGSYSLDSSYFESYV